MILVLLDFVILGKQGNLKSIWIMYLWEAVIAACQTVPPPYILLQVNFYETILLFLIDPQFEVIDFSWKFKAISSTPSV